MAPVAAKYPQQQDRESNSLMLGNRLLLRAISVGTLWTLLPGDQFRAAAVRQGWRGEESVPGVGKGEASLPGVDKGEASLPTAGSVTFFGAPASPVSIFRQPPNARVIVATTINRISVLTLFRSMFTFLSPAPPSHQDHGVTVAFKGSQRAVAIDFLQREARFLQ
jgi:hypothetical protein